MNIVTDVILPLALAFIMFGLGLGLTGGDFLRVIKQPRDFFVGAISQIVLLPIVAFIIVATWTFTQTWGDLFALQMVVQGGIAFYLFVNADD